MYLTVFGISFEGIEAARPCSTWPFRQSMSLPQRNKYENPVVTFRADLSEEKRLDETNEKEMEAKKCCHMQ